MTKDSSPLTMGAGVLAAVGASICCAGPLLLLLLGVSGSWISALTLLEPYRPIFVGVVIALFGWAGWALYRPMSACAPGTACAVTSVRTRRRIAFWISAVIALLLVTSNYWLLILFY